MNFLIYTPPMPEKPMPREISLAAAAAAAFLITGISFLFSVASQIFAGAGYTAICHSPFPFTVHRPESSPESTSDITASFAALLPAGSLLLWLIFLEGLGVWRGS